MFEGKKTVVSLVAASFALAAFSEVPRMSPVGDARVYMVQPTPAYNSWPMIQSVGDKVVCAYSRGSAHTIGEGKRGVYARTSSDGGKTWGSEVLVTNDPSVGEVTIGKGLDENGRMLLWVRRWGASKGHDLYRTADGSTFEKISTPSFSPMPMQVTDVFHVPGRGLISLWFAGDYRNKTDGHSWGTLTSADNGRTWVQRAIEKDLPKSEWPTEQCAVHLGGGRILAIARSEGGTKYQFQLTSTDGGVTWKRQKTNISDVQESTPSLFFDAKTGQVFNYYYQRGAKKLKRRVVSADCIFTRPTMWPEPETLAVGAERRAYDAGNVNGTVHGGSHLLALYTGSTTDTAVFAVSVPASVDDGFAVVAWNVGHHARGVGRHPLIPPGRDGEFRRKCLDLIGNARVVGLSEYSHVFSTNSPAGTAETLFPDYALKLEGTDMFPQCNSIFVKDGRLVGTEERRYPKRKRAKYYKFARVVLDGREVCVIVTHLDFDTGPDDPLRETRADQMRALIAETAKEKHVIICGDFNISSRPGDTKDHAAEYDVFAEAGYTLAHRGGLMTWPAQKNPRREAGLDNIMVKGFEMSEVRTESFPAFSDHKLLGCRLRFKD